MFITLELPPGAFRNGTQYQTSGRFYAMNLSRWIGDALRPVKGWRSKTETTLAGKARAILTWKDNDRVAHCAVGTHSKLYHMGRDGTVTDITPTVPDAFTAGSVDSAAGGGYGSGAYGAGTYGTPRPDVADIQEASVWTLDHRGEDLIGCMEGDGRIWIWTLNVANDALKLANSPLAVATFVSNEKNVVAIGADDVGQRVAWSDDEDATLWTAAATNTAGDIDLQTPGALKCGKRIKGVNVIWSDFDVWTMRPTFDQLVYGFERLATSCGVISKQAIAGIDEKAVWMGKDNFWLYNGGVAILPCEVHDYVFGDLNQLQAAKVTCVRLSQYSEVWWFYPSASATENNRYVAWNHETGVWSFGELSRTCGADKGAFLYPLMVNAAGAIFEHEVGNAYDGATPYAEGGPIELGGGDLVMRATALIPDEATLGDAQVAFKTRMYPMGPQINWGPYTLTERTDVRFSGRQVSVRYSGVRNVDWRVGRMRLDVSPAGLR